MHPRIPYTSPPYLLSNQHWQRICTMKFPLIWRLQRGNGGIRVHPYLFCLQLNQWCTPNRTYTLTYRTSSHQLIHPEMSCTKITHKNPPKTGSRGGPTYHTYPNHFTRLDRPLMTRIAPYRRIFMLLRKERLPTAQNKTRYVQRCCATPLHNYE